MITGGRGRRTRRSRLWRSLKQAGGPPWLSRLILVALLLSAMETVPDRSAHPVVAQAGGEACTTSGPDSGAFTVAVCLAEVDGDVTGDVEITATLELISGVLPESVQMEFSLAKLPSTSDRNVLTDYLAPYSFVLPTDRYVDGRYRLEATAEFPDTFDAESPSIEMTFANGVREAPNPPAPGSRLPDDRASQS